MGRPSSLGSDEYHNRDFPYTDAAELPTTPHRAELLDPPHCAIIRSMVDFSRITRHVCIKVYLTQNSLTRTVELAQQLDQVLDEWLASLPETTRPAAQATNQSVLTSSKEAIWMKRQKLVLHIRYLNLRILLFGSILLTSTRAERSAIPGSYDGIQRCLDSAKATIEIIYETYKHHEFFRTWSVPSFRENQPPPPGPRPRKKKSFLLFSIRKPYIPHSSITTNFCPPPPGSTTPPTPYSPRPSSSSTSTKKPPKSRSNP